MNKQQRKTAEQALADHYHVPCHIDDVEEMRFFRMYANRFDGFWVSVNRPDWVPRTIIMIEVEDGWHIEENPWT